MKGSLLRNLSQPGVYLPLLAYSLVALFVLGPLLGRGFVFAADMVFVPHPPMPTELTSTYPYEVLLHWLSVLVPMDVMQKVFLFASIVVSGIGMHRLAQQWLPAAKTQAIWFFAGGLYAVNPFVYSRFMMGQYLIVAGYALLPVVLRSLQRFMDRPRLVSAAATAAWLILVGVFSIHMFGVAMLMTTVLVAFWWARKGRLKLPIRHTVWLGLFIAAGTCYWWLPVLLGDSVLQATTQQFTQADAIAFATPGTWWSVIAHLFALQGFWADSQSLYQLPQQIYWWWWLPIVLLWTLVAIGIHRAYRQKSVLLWPLLSIGAIGVMLAIGASGTVFAAGNLWLVQHVPFFSGYREPQKFIAMLCVAYGYFGALGIEAVLGWLRRWRDIATSILLLVPVGLAPLMGWGFAGQLHTSHYPTGWYEARSYIQHHCTGNCHTLFLPWHLYMHYDFAGRIIANPAPKFFGGKAIASTDPEIAGASGYTWTSSQQTVDHILLSQAWVGSDNLAADLAKLDVGYVVLINSQEDGSYRFFGEQKDITLVKENRSLRIYKVGD